MARGWWRSGHYHRQLHHEFPVFHVTCAILAVAEKCQTKLDLHSTDHCDRESMKIWNVKKLIMETRPSGKIEAQGLGIAAVSDQLLQQRAQDWPNKMAAPSSPTPTVHTPLGN